MVIWERELRKCGRTGYKGFILRRKLLLDALLGKIWDQEKILLNKRVGNIGYEEGKVVVTCKDGSKYYGDLVVGCDGVNSVVRDEMWRISDLEKGKETKEDRDCECDNFVHSGTLILVSKQKLFLLAARLVLTDSQF